MIRNHKLKADYGMSDYYKFYKKKLDNPVNSLLYNQIITKFNDEIKDLIIEDNLTYQLPFLGFEIVLKKQKRIPKIVNGKLINNIPPDWKATNELWDKDAEAKEKKLLVRYNNYHTSNYIYRIYFKKFKSKIKNKSLFKFQPNRTFKRQLSARIKDTNKGNLNAYLLY